MKKTGKKGRFWELAPAAVVLGILAVILTGVTFFLNRTVFFVELVALAAAAAFAGWRILRIQRSISRYMSRILRQLNQADQDSLAAFPLPVLVLSDEGEVIWYNGLFRSHVLDGEEAFGDSVGRMTGGKTMQEVAKRRQLEVVCGGRQYTVYTGDVRVRDATLYVLYYVDNTELKRVAEEYALSRPAVMLIYIDNIEELIQNMRDSERAQLAGRVETLLEDWVASLSGILRKYSSDRFMVVIEQRYLQPVLDSRFEILDRVRAIQTADHVSLTLSIGLGQGDTFRDCESMARQALDMALGRGGDQAAVKTNNGFDFFGGVSKGVERRTKVRTRVVASALAELIAGSDTVLVMGHRFSDLDCLGSAVALTAAARGVDRTAYTVVRRETTLAGELIDRFEDAGRGDLFIEPEQAMPLLTKKTLLIITDTHNPAMLESEPLYRAAQTVVVVDHHRKMVNYISDAVIFYHEPYSSSASEMVAELVQYMGGRGIARLEAEALLAGIMLDTRSFVMKAGVRTFEAAAYLRKLGADTVEVKRMFSGSMELYRKKSAIIAKAEIYRRTAISCDEEGGTEVRVAAAQAADELLSIKGVDASFTLFVDDGVVNISARSLGDFNVQLVMEALGGGGHLTMAGAQLPDVTLEQARQRLIQAIDEHWQSREHALAAQNAKE